MSEVPLQEPGLEDACGRDCSRSPETGTLQSSFPLRYPGEIQLQSNANGQDSSPNRLDSCIREPLLAVEWGLGFREEDQPPLISGAT